MGADFDARSFQLEFSFMLIVLPSGLSSLFRRVMQVDLSWLELLILGLGNWSRVVVLSFLLEHQALRRGSVQHWNEPGLFNLSPRRLFLVRPFWMLSKSKCPSSQAVAIFRIAGLSQQLIDQICCLFNFIYFIHITRVMVLISGSTSVSLVCLEKRAFHRLFDIAKLLPWLASLFCSSWMSPFINSFLLNNFLKNWNQNNCSC